MSRKFAYFDFFVLEINRNIFSFAFAPPIFATSKFFFILCVTRFLLFLHYLIEKVMENALIVLNVYAVTDCKMLILAFNWKLNHSYSLFTVNFISMLFIQDF